MKRIVFIWVIACSCNFFQPGSYPYAQMFSYEISEDSLISMLIALKASDPSFDVPELEDGHKVKDDYWYKFYFYNASAKDTYFFWVRGKGIYKAEIGFVSVNKGRGFGNWKDINKDFDSKENETKILEFRTAILNKLPVKPED